MSILITGGAGYIGSHTVAEVLEHGQDVVVLDDLRLGHRQAVPIKRFYQGSVGDEQMLDRVFSENRIEAVIHFAAYTVVSESVADPLSYYDNNLVAAQRLLTKMRQYKVDKIVFSSTCATYGVPLRTPLHEDDPTNPTSPYGETKLAIERMLHWCDVAYGIRAYKLRYFNAAGAHLTKDIGEDHTPETHLIPLVLKAALGQQNHITIYGNDYPTEDGTCIRDYIHVMDLASAHWLALEKLRAGAPSSICNLGSGEGYSVQQVIDKARAITGCRIPVEIGPRRAGDPPILIASSDKARSELGWKPKLDNLDDIISSAWRWHKNHPEGFRSKSKVAST